MIMNWSCFASRSLAGLGLVLMGTSLPGMLAADQGNMRWIGLLWLAGLFASFAYLLVRAPRCERADRMIDWTTSVHAGLVVLTLIIGQELAMALGAFESGPVSVFAMPGIFIMVKTAEAQLLRVARANNIRIPGLRALNA